MIGTIKRLRGDKGFGFILSEDGQEYFFHASQVIPRGEFESLTPGKKVSYELEPGPKGMRAVDVSLVS